MILSDKQKSVFHFFSSDYDILIADGAVRSGKTYSLFYAYLMWSTSFKGQDFGIGGRTIGTLKRNIIHPYAVPLSKDVQVILLGGIKFNWSDNYFTFCGNTFYWYGGDKETSQFYIQGKTLAGLFCDEVVSMQRSFIDQAMARCSVDGAKIIYSCNPSNPSHFFKTDFIDRAEELNALYMHWDMDDNPSLSDKVKARYRRMYTGVFYERFILGRWVAAEGTIFLQFAENPERWVIDTPSEEYSRLFVGGDFGGSKSKTVFVLSGIVDTENGPQIHILRSHKVKDTGYGIDSEQIAREYASFIGMAVHDFNMLPHVSYVDHMEMLRLSLKKAVAEYAHNVLFVDKGTITLFEWCKSLNTLFNLDMIKIVRGNDIVVEAFKGLLYDQKAADDRPLDDGITCDVDTYDAVRYSIVGIVKDWTKRGLLEAYEVAA